MYLIYLYKNSFISTFKSSHFCGETERKSGVVLCCESKSTLHPPPRAPLCLRLRHMSRHRRLERRPVTTHTPSIRSISLSGSQFSHFPQKWHQSSYLSVIVHVGCGCVWLNLSSHAGPLRSKQREWEKCTFMWSPNEFISGELVRDPLQICVALSPGALVCSGHPRHSIQLTTLKAESRNKGNGNGYLVQTARLTVCSDD